MGKAYGVRMELVWNMYGTTRSQHANSRRGTGWDYRACKEGRGLSAGVQEPASVWGRGRIHRVGRARQAGDSETNGHRQWPNNGGALPSRRFVTIPRLAFRLPRSLGAA